MHSITSIRDDSSWFQRWMILLRGPHRPSVKQYISLILALNCLCTLYLGPPLQPGPAFFTEQCQLLRAEKQSLFNPSKGKCCIFSLGDYGNTIKRVKSYGGSYIFSPLCTTYPTFHPLSIFPLRFFHPLPFGLLSLPSPFLFVCRGSSYKPEMLLWRFHKELRFQPLSRRMACGGVWGYFKSCFLIPLSPIPHSSPFPFFHTALFRPYFPPLLQASLTLWWNVRTETGGKKQLIGRQ